MRECGVVHAVTGVLDDEFHVVALGERAARVDDDFEDALLDPVPIGEDG